MSVMIQIDCVSCGGANGKPEPGMVNCPLCEEVLTLERLASEALDIEKDGLLTEEDYLHGSITGC
jgi:uncharacterized Zn finger protein (UPF0148 family)